MPERFRGELLTMGRYTNPASFPSFLYTHIHQLLAILLGEPA